MRRRHLLGAGEKEEVLHTIRTVLTGFDEIEVGYVFGSFCREDFGDVDVAILVAGEPAPYQAMRFARRAERELEQALGYRFEADVKILNTAPISFQHEVIKSGRLVFSRDRERRIRYEAGVLSASASPRTTDPKIRTFRASWHVAISQIRSRSAMTRSLDACTCARIAYPEISPCTAF